MRLSSQLPPAISDGLGNRLDQTRPVGSNQRENEIDHGYPCILTIPQ